MNRHAWSRTPVAETSWALLRDCYHGIMCIRHTPQHIAIATLYLALNSYGVELPVGEKEWWQVCVCIQYYRYQTRAQLQLPDCADQVMEELKTVILL